MDTILEANLRSLKQPDQDQSLASKLLASFVPSNFQDPARDYLPDKCITDLITGDRIEGEFEKGDQVCDTAQLRELTLWVCAKACRTFAITVQCDLGSIQLLLAMLVFKKTHFDDEKLPLADPQQIAASPEQFDRRIWSDLKLRDFYDKQWRCLVPVFSPDRYDYNLLDKCIFPFTKESAIPKVGAFSSVHKVQIHPDHQKHQQMHKVSDNSLYFYA